MIFCGILFDSECKSNIKLRELKKSTPAAGVNSNFDSRNVYFFDGKVFTSKFISANMKLQVIPPTELCRSV